MEKEQPALSKRGQVLLDRPVMPVYLQEHFTRLDDVWSADHNPNGYLPLCIAENRLVWDLLMPRFATHRDVPEEALGYADMVGPQAFREILATFLETWVTGAPVRPDQLAPLEGSGRGLEVGF